MSDGINGYDLPANYFGEDPEASNVGQSPFIVGGGTDDGRRGETIEESPYKDLSEFKTGYTNPEGNLEKDYVVGERGQIIDTGGNLVRDSSGIDSSGFLDQIKKFLGKDSFLSKVIGGAEKDPLSGLLGLYMMSKLLKSGSTTPQVAGYKGPGINMNLAATRQAFAPAQRAYGQGAMGGQMLSPVTYANEGGLMALAKGRYLRGETDGMADKIPSNIDGKQPAALSHGEFVIPADVVSHLGNGNSDAGAKELYKMMDRVRMARTGNKKQGKRINPNKFTPGGQAYAGGGMVAFSNGGQTQTGPAVTTQTPGGTSTQQNLAEWAGPYVTDYLSKSRALAQLPYEAYTGALSAGMSPLQQQAFMGMSNMQMPWNFNAGSGMAYQAGLGSFTQPGTSEAFMSPYMRGVTDIAKREAKRQSDIQNLQNKAAFARAGAFGGSRQAIVEAERQRNLAQQMGDIEERGLQSAYDRATQQYNAERDAQLRAAMGLGTLGQQQFGAQLQGLQAILGAGGAQRQVEQDAVTALRDEFERQRMWPYKQLEFQRNMLQGLPVAAQATTPNVSPYDELLRKFLLGQNIGQAVAGTGG